MECNYNHTRYSACGGLSPEQCENQYLSEGCILFTWVRST
ncbi:hypothetical protein EXT68_21945 [Pectobacterium parmentieri]|uniref:Uncharacterized protein n=1 Tax=Pectobacterium parmentieri TaxID=1905730 RepID=A0ABS0S209_PECPM|nr:hypothetical protein [Pectobacterium parmentieri]MBI0494647.1 hypothetical protein [Pectobacterium parmentieri]MBI0555883.1 hypothetical protein [Pectobacterium parmentieri]MBI0568975.1 hypothetical protein [Pectobacterium parmentieri]MBI0573808.1 hypothetical protein [Pectobacterium parmentieri]